MASTGESFKFIVWTRPEDETYTYISHNSNLVNKVCSEVKGDHVIGVESIIKIGVMMPVFNGIRKW